MIGILKIYTHVDDEINCQSLADIGGGSTLTSHVRLGETEIDIDFKSKKDFYEKLSNYIALSQNPYSVSVLRQKFEDFSYLFAFLKLRYPLVAEELENALVDNHLKALLLMATSSNFLSDPVYNLRFDSLTHSLAEIKIAENLLGQNINFKEISFPCEIGKFLLKKLTYAPKGLRACNELIDHYSSYDLQKVNSSLNEAILENDHDIILKNVEDISEILNTVWEDKTLPKRIRNIRIGMPLIIGAVGTIATNPLVGLIGLLAGLGIDAGSGILEANTEGLSEKTAKLFSRNHQINIYEFQKKYKQNIVR